LSQRKFFHLFVPKISLFLPRFLIPIFSVFFIDFFITHKKKYSQIFIFFMLLVSIKINTAINIKNFYYPTNKLVITKPNSIFLPPWENLYLQNIYSKTDLEQISRKFTLSQQIEKELLSTPLNCSTVHQFPNIIFLSQTTPSIKGYQDKLLNSLEYCLTTTPQIQ